MYRSLYHKEAKALMVSTAGYLKNRNGNYSLRFRIPSDLSPLLPQAEIVKSLRTSDLKTAKVSALPYVQSISQTFSLLRSGFITTAQATERLVSLMGNSPKGGKSSEAATVSQEACMESASMVPVGGLPFAVGLSAFIRTYTKDKEQDWTEKSKMEIRGIFKLLLELLGDVPIHSIDRNTVRTLRDNLQKLPPNVSKLHPELSPLEVIKRIDSGKLPSSPVLSLTSVNKHLSRLSYLMLHAVREGLRSDNPVSGLRIKQNRRQDEERKAYDLEDIRKIAENLPRDQDKPERLWVPMLCMLGGLRLDEACQLYKEDVRDIDGIWCLDVNGSKDKKIKNSSSNRMIPIHPKLIDMGFLKYVEGCTDEERLWGNLTYCKVNGYSNSLGKWYQRFNRRYVTTDKLKTLHSLRHSFADGLKQQRVEKELISELMGHAQESITMSRYGKRYKPEVLLEVVKMIDYQF